ncbi:MAG TPA: aromatic amino acid lyase, partial [Candidatus Limnocylindrales bacterium]
MTAERVVLTGADLTVARVEAVARRGVEATLDPGARRRMKRSRAVVEKLVADGEVVYGVTTGVGALANRSIGVADVEQLQENLLVSHAAGVGDPLPREVVRAMLVLRANTLALGFSGARPIVAERLLDFLRLGIHPVIP